MAITRRRLVLFLLVAIAVSLGMYTGTQLTSRTRAPSSTTELPLTKKHLYGPTEVPYYDKCRQLKAKRASKTTWNTMEYLLALPDIFSDCGNSKPKFLSSYDKNRLKANIIPPRSELLVPNVIHLVHFDGEELPNFYANIGVKSEFTFLNFVSLISMDKFIQPAYIFVHGNVAPSGVWWEAVLEQVKNLVFIHREMPTQVFNKTLTFIQHASDVARFQIISEFGGIYLDQDVLVLRSFDPLRKYQVSVARESDKRVCNGIIIAEPGSRFVNLWLKSYAFYTGSWSESVRIGHLLTNLDLDVNVETDLLVRPSFLEAELLFKGHYDWTDNYSIHVWKSEGHVPSMPTELITTDSTLGEVMRYIITRALS